ncbi:MAG: precorrin-3B C(17)-methyltransferase [Actinomycetota bacterium]|nr:precorrin-3B C(17)-methyltransferase [Actinomycetota bacterium]
MIGLVAVTAAGRAGAAQLAAAWPGETHIFAGPAAETVPAAFAACEGLVCFLATGATVRLLAPHLGDKHADPGVVCVDESRRFAVALLGGHGGGANALAERVAGVLGAAPVVTTASDAAGIPALDELGWSVEGAVAAVGRALLDGEPVTLVADATWPLPSLGASLRPAPPVLEDRHRRSGATRRGGAPETSLSIKGEDQGEDKGEGGRAARLVVTDELVEPHGRTAVLRPPSLVVGVGASRGVTADEVLALVDETLRAAGLSAASVTALATVDVKADEAGIVEAARRRGWPLGTHPAQQLAALAVPNPSEVVRAEVGTPSVAEAAALAGADELVVPKQKSAMATVAVARRRPRGRLALVGLGPGARDLLTPRAVSELRRASTVVGLDQYVEQVRDLLRPGTRILASGLGDEEARARSAVELAREGHAVALIGSGDAGVYAMASPALEVAGEDIDVVGVPGITAALAAAALLGAPLGHDSAMISLSDLHTPWEAIEQRVRAAAEGDLVITFYNPRSRGRDWQLPKALGILAAHRPPDTPVGLVRNASRDDESVRITTLQDVDVDAVDMLTVVIVGSTNTRTVTGRMVTPRGYRWLPT